MRWMRWSAVSMVILTGAIAGLSLSCSPAAQTSATPAAMTPEEKVARGQYMVSVMGCGDCHTPGTIYGAPDMTRQLSGSEVGWVGPWGVVCARNLTPDSTGLMGWTEDQIATAIRTGNRPDGRQLAPIMPWAAFANLTDEDAHAIAAYLQTLPAVSHHVPDPVPPGQKPAGPTIVIPPPSEWDGRNLPVAPSGH